MCIVDNITQANEGGGSFTLIKSGDPLFKEFLIKSEKYKQNIVDNSSGRAEISFPQGDLTFVDTFVTNFEKYIGVKMVFDKKAWMWQMNYARETLPKADVIKLAPKEICSFIQEARKIKAADLYDFRKAATFTKGKWFYINNAIGSLDKFHGKELIYYDQNLICKGLFHGYFIDFEPLS